MFYPGPKPPKPEGGEYALELYREENLDLQAKIRFLLETHKLWSEDGTYSFPDGDTWRVG
jgi:hypothetical protein